ncbi:MAG: carboxypeptidase-like regulatory domain-containing protein [Bacteroidota bacterium]
MNKPQIRRDECNLRAKYILLIPANNTLLMNIILYPTIKTSFLGNMVRMDVAKEAQARNSMPITAEKNSLKALLSFIIWKFCLRASVQAADLEKHELESSLIITEFFILNLDDDTALTQAKVMLKIITDNISILTIIETEDVAAIQQAIDDYANYLNMPESVIKQKKAEGTDMLDQILNDIDKDKNKIGRLIHSYELPFAHDWDVANIIGKSTGTRHQSIKIKYIDADTDAPIKKVKTTITNASGTITHVFYSTKRGWVTIYSLETGNWTITSEYQNYVTDTKVNVGVFDKKLAKFEIKLQKITPTTTGSFLATCKNKDTNLPIYGLHGTITANNQVINANSDAQLLAENLIPGDYTILISGDNIITQTFHITITAGSQTTLIFPIDPTPPPIPTPPTE